LDLLQLVVAVVVGEYPIRLPVVVDRVVVDVDLLTRTQAARAQQDKVIQAVLDIGKEQDQLVVVVAVVMLVLAQDQTAMQAGTAEMVFSCWVLVLLEAVAVVMEIKEPGGVDLAEMAVVVAEELEMATQHQRALAVVAVVDYTVAKLAEVAAGLE
jgi:hypothetical protein